MAKVKIKTLSQFIKEGKEQDESPEAVYLASEINLLDKADQNSEEINKDTKNIDKKKAELADKYKKITGHDDTSKSIPEAKEMQEVVDLYEGLMQDLGIKGWNEFGQKYKTQIKSLVSEVGGNYIGYTYDPPTQTIAIVTDKGIGKYYFDPDSQEFDQYQIQKLDK